MLPKDSIQLLLDTGKSQLPLVDNQNGNPFLIRPDGTAFDLSDFFAPRRIEATPKFSDADSFVAYVKLYAQVDAIIFAAIDAAGAQFEAILDYHSINADADEQYPANTTHRAYYATQSTPEWATWRGQNRKAMNQVEFATWVEDNLPLFEANEVVQAPSPAVLMEMAQTLHGQTNVRYNTIIRLHTGAQRIKWEENNEVNTVVQGKDMVFPAVLAGRFPLFEGGEPTSVTARLKTRVENRQLKVHFETISEAQLVRRELMAIATKIATETALIPYLGTPA